jgi:cell division transport system permease protein
MLTRLWRIVKLGLINFVRNWTLSLAAVLIISLTLIMVTVFMVINFAVSDTTEAIQKKIDLKAYFDDSVPVEEIRDIELKIKSRFDVTSVVFIDKDQALERWKKRSISQKTKDLITREDNPLPRTLEIKSSNPKVLEEITQILSSKAYQGKIYKISFEENKPIIEKMFRATNLASLTIGLLALILMVLSIIVVYNTIRLTIFSRQEEIQIMELVGASSAFIRLPFIIEALFYGIIAVLMALGIMSLGIKLAVPAIINSLGFSWLDIRQALFERLWLIVLIQSVIGLVISIISSLILVRRYLN